MGAYYTQPSMWYRSILDVVLNIKIVQDPFFFFDGHTYSSLGIYALFSHVIVE